MAEPLEREIRLDIAPALGSIRELDDGFEGLASRIETLLAQAVSSGIEQGISGFSEQIEVDVTADTEEAEAEVEQLGDIDPVEIPVGADTTEAEAGIDEVVGIGESEEIEIPVTVDTGDAEAQLDALGDSGAEAAGGLGDAALASDGLSKNLFGATAASDEAALALGKIGPAGIGIGATAGALALLAKRGIDVLEVQQQFNDTFGESADAVRQIDVAGLNTDLEELSLSLGSDDEALLAATARAGAFAKTLGLSQDETANFAKEIVALGAFVNSVNPQLGSIDQIINQIARTAARSPQGLGRLGLDVDPNRLAALAAELGKVPEELTRGERAALAVKAALEGAGDVSDDVAKRQNNAGVILRSTLERVQDLIEDVAVPVAVPVVEALSSLGPLLTSLSPLARVFGQGISLALRGAIVPLASFAQIFGDLVEGIGSFVEEANQIPFVGRAIPDDLGDALVDFGANVSDSAAETRRLIQEGSGLEESMEDVASATPPATGALDDYAESTEDAVDPTVELEQAIQDLADSAIAKFPTAGDALATFTGDLESAFGDLVSAQERLAEGADGAAGEVEAAQARLEEASDPQRFIDNLNLQTLAVVGFQQNLRTLLNQGLDDLVAFLIKQGPEAGGALAQSLVNEPELAASADRAIRTFGEATANSKEFLELRGAELVDNLTTGVETEAEAQRPTIDEKIGTLFAGTTTVAADGGTETGIGFVLGIGRGLDNDAAIEHIRRRAREVADAVTDTIQDILGIGSPSRVAAELASEVVAGMALGLEPTDALAQAAEVLALAATPQLDPAAFTIPPITVAAVAAPGAAAAGTTGEGTDLPAAGRSITVMGPLVETHDVADPLHISTEIAWELSR